MTDPARDPGDVGLRLRSALRAHALPCAITLLVGAALFGRALLFDFVHYDDYEVLVMNYGSFVSRSNAVGAFWQDFFAVLGPGTAGVYYRPLLVATYAVEAQLAATDPFLYHATNVALHLLASCLAYALLVTFGSGRWLSLGLALVFCCHPAAAALVVAWIPCRNESLLAIWSIACTLLLVAFLRTGRRSALAFSLVCLVGVVFTKESGAGLLAVLACVVVIEATGRPGERRDLLWAAAGALVVTGGWAALRRVALGAFPVNTSFVLENLSVLVVYLGKTLFPVGLAAIPHPEDTSLLPGLAALGVLGLAIAHTGRRLYGVAGLGLVWYAAFLLPTLLVPRQTWGLEHRIYVPLLGMLLFAARLRPPAWLPASATLGPALALGVALLFGIVTARRLPDFAGPIPYWESAARSAPHSELAATGLAWRYYEAEELNAAIEAASTALALNPEEPAMYYLRAIVYRQRGFFDRAEADLRLALDLDPDNVGAWTNLASLQRRMGRREESRRSQRRAEQLRERHSADRED